MEMLDQKVKTHLAKTAEYFQRMEGGMPSVQERLATLNAEVWYGQTFCPGHLIAGMLSLHLALDHLIILNSFAYPKVSQMFPKTSFFVQETSSFWLLGNQGNTKAYL